MNKRLALCTGIILMLSALGGALLNLYSLPASERTVEMTSLEEIERLNNDWQKVLSQLPQFAPSETSESTEVSVESQPEISDSLLVAIIADRPRSALIIVTEQNAGQPMQLAEGDSWLEPWKIETINTDFIVWRNSQTEEQYTQTLFPQGNGSDKVQE
ncbi:hypothetical protein [Lacimicrobium alkaliphilum]|uniref:Type II secretion system protein GspC N-terminal domain-containing protein n=1 Tax=Lacimicrobium alkaliphilum TaxID=1526571 RepID=A0ABQ1R663_9ALTE|nr:hypothetical protein [Lacimicrobium alkaliphilum]GGD57654.1 hypothetical protein GCM10011357_11310 [Lacimicrobium alkaliphilum]